MAGAGGGTAIAGSVAGCAGGISAPVAALICARTFFSCCSGGGSCGGVCRGGCFTSSMVGCFGGRPRRTADFKADGSCSVIDCLLSEIASCWVVPVLCLESSSEGYVAIPARPTSPMALIPRRIIGRESLAKVAFMFHAVSSLKSKPLVPTPVPFCAVANCCALARPSCNERASGLR